MKTVSFITQKGGSGKTTLVVSTAVAASEAGKKTLIIDTDKQGTARDWYQDRPEDKDYPHLVDIEPGQIGKALEMAEKKGFDLVLIDTAGRDSVGNKAVIRKSDFVLVPCRPTVADMRAAVPSVQAIKDENKKFSFVINQSSHQFRRANDASKSLAGLGSVCPITVVLRTAYQDSQFQGLGVSESDPDSKAHHEIKRLWKWLDNLLFTL